MGYSWSSHLFLALGIGTPWCGTVRSIGMRILKNFFYKYCYNSVLFLYFQKKYEYPFPQNLTQNECYPLLLFVKWKAFFKKIFKSCLSSLCYGCWTFFCCTKTFLVMRASCYVLFNIHSFKNKIEWERLSPVWDQLLNLYFLLDCFCTSF